MKSKFNIYIDKEIKSVAEKLAKQREISVSELFEDLIRSEREIDRKLKALEKVSGSINVDPSVIHESDFRDYIIKKHGWNNA